MFVNINTGEKMSWGTWEKGEPRNLSTNNSICARYGFPEEEIFTDVCFEFCPVCQIPSQTRFVLKGDFPEAAIDNYYFLQPSGDLLGLTKIGIIWSDEKGHWEIINFLLNEVRSLKFFAFGYPDAP